MRASVRKGSHLLIGKVVCLNKNYVGEHTRAWRAILQLTDSMKQALVLQGNMSESEATALWNSVVNAQEK